MALDHEYQAKERVRVDDGRSRFAGHIVGKSARNTAEYEVIDDEGRAWFVHWAYLRREGDR